MTDARLSGDPRAVGRAGAWFIVLAALQWGALGTVARVAFAERADPLTVAFWRASLAALLFGVHATVTRAAPLRSADRWSAVALGTGGVAVLYVTYLKSVEAGGVALAAILLYSAPLWVALGARVFFHERLTPRALLALGLTLVGVVMVALASGEGVGGVTVSSAGLVWGLISGLTYALYYLLGRPLFTHNAPARVLAWALAIGAAALWPFVTFTPLSLKAWGAVSFMAAVSTYGAYLSYAHGMRRLMPSRAATIATLEPVVAVIAAYVVWQERLSPLGLAGAVAVLAGVIWSARNDG